MLIDLDTFQRLCSTAVREAIEANIERDPLDIALDKSVADAAIVAGQVKYLQRAKRKLPSYYRARCIFPPRGFEQSSSEQTASNKALEGESLLELTCGMGVDALYLSRRFGRVVTLERDEMLASITRENFRRLGVENVEIITQSAEVYLATTTECFDAIYVDPDRRDASQRRLVRLEDCSPNVRGLLEVLRERSKLLCVKLSPLFDVDEAFEIFAPCRVEVVALGDECKEVVVTLPVEANELVATAIGVGSVVRQQGQQGWQSSAKCCEEFVAEEFRYLISPNVALQKSRMACLALPEGVKIWDNNSYGFSKERVEGFLGRCDEIERIEIYNPKRLKRWLKEQNISRLEILKRSFPISTATIIKQLGVKEGGERRVAFTEVSGVKYAIFLR